MVSQWFVVGTRLVVFLQKHKNHDNLERGTLQCLYTEEISTSDVTKLWWGMKARGAEGHRLVQKRWDRLEKVEVGFWVMKGLNKLRWQGTKMTRRAWETSGWFYLKLQDKNMRGNKIRGNVTQALGKNKPEIPVADLTPVSLTDLPTSAHWGGSTTNQIPPLPSGPFLLEEKKSVKKNELGGGMCYKSSQ